MMGKHFQLCDYDWMCFLTAQFMNELNINLQGLKHLENEIYDKIIAFKRKLLLWEVQQ
jgi:hypothetical protein